MKVGSGAGDASSLSACGVLLFSGKLGSAVGTLCDGSGGCASDEAGVKVAIAVD